MAKTVNVREHVRIRFASSPKGIDALRDWLVNLYKKYNVKRRFRISNDREGVWVFSLGMPAGIFVSVDSFNESMFATDNYLFEVDDELRRKAGRK